MTKNTPNKRKSLANVTATPNKLQKFTGSPKNGKSPKGANKNQNTPQKKFIKFVGQQGTPKGKKNINTEDDEELEENVSDESIEQEEMNDSDEDVEQGDSDEDVEQGDSDEDVEQGDSDEDVEQNGSDEDEQDKKESITANDRKYSVYVGGCSYDTTKDDLRQYFNKESILSVNLLKKPGTKLSKGSAFINFKDETSQMKSLQKNGTKFRGRTIQVSLPATKKTVLEKKQAYLQKLKEQVRNMEQEIENFGKESKNPIKGKKVQKA